MLQKQMKKKYNKLILKEFQVIFPLGNPCLSEPVNIDFYCETLVYTHMYKY